MQRLGVGGMGEVWLAKEHHPRRSVALKFVRPELLRDASFRTRFRNEAETLAGLEHDRIVALYRLLEEEGHLALVLRYIQGSTLADRIDGASGPLPLDFVLSVARDVLQALGFAHRRGTIHRDIKPQNILVDVNGHAFLTDFGIAVGDAVERNTVAGFAIGTPHYMSPEQIRTPHLVTADGLGVQSDIYSVGVVLYEMLTGRVPFGADLGSDHAFVVQRAHVEESPRPLRELNPAVSPGVEQVVLACLAKQPELRPSSCEALLTRLEAVTSKSARSTFRVATATVVEPVRPAAPEPHLPIAPEPRRTASSWRKARAVIAGLAIAGGLILWTTLSIDRRAAPATPSEGAGAAPPATKPGVSTVAGDRATDHGRTKGQPREGSPSPEVRGEADVATQPPPQPPAPEDTARLVREASSLRDQEQWCAAAERLNRARQRGRALMGAELDLYEEVTQMCSAVPPP